MRMHAALALIEGAVRPEVGIEIGEDGSIVAVERDAAPARADLRLGGLVVPGFANTHSHAFHRLLRGRTHAGGGDFWSWRSAMYAVAASLTPESLREVATGLYREMVTAGYTAVGEFHYLHHRPDGRPYADHDMELALADAAETAGIALTLLDTCYLRGGFGSGLGPEQLGPEQRRFSDGSVADWRARWESLRDRLASSHPAVTLGAAVHSVRALAPEDIAELVGGLPPDVPLHAHLSEQPAENADCLAATGLTPTRVLDAAGALGPRTTVVHATHLDPDDVELLGQRGVVVSICPSTEADLGDGLGHAEDLARAGAGIAIGSDQQVLIDPIAELRGLEWGARLRAGRRGVFPPERLWAAGTADGAAALSPLGAAAAGSIAVGRRADLVELDTASVRTAGSEPEQLLASASAADVRTVIANGVLRNGARR